MAKVSIELREGQVAESTPELGSLLDADTLGQWAWVLAYTAVLSSISVLRYHLWIANGLDLGQYEQGLWLILHKGLLAPSTYTGQPILALTGSFVLILLAPFYAIGGVGLLLVLQSFALGSGYFFVRRIAISMGAELRTAHLLGALYLIYPTVLGVNLFDFHPQVLGIPILLALIWAVLRERWVALGILSVLALLVDVSTSLLLLGVGVVLLARKKPLPGALLALSALVAGYLDLAVLLPTLGHGAVPAWSDYYRGFGATPSAGIARLLGHPEMLFTWGGQLRPWEYVVWLVATPVALALVYRRLGVSLWWIPALLLMEANLVSGQAIRTSPFNEFSLLAAPFIFAGLSDLLTKRGFTVPKVRLSYALAVPLVLLLVFVWQQRHTYWREIPYNATALQAATLAVPQEAPIVAQNFDVAHLADRAQEWLPTQATSMKLAAGTFIILDPAVHSGTTPQGVLTQLQAELHGKGQARQVFTQDGVEVYELLRPLVPSARG